MRLDLHSPASNLDMLQQMMEQMLEHEDAEQEMESDR